ncbi:MAG: GIY-YIG nuclease family protein [Nitrospirae bacterium]|nr:GIY-YIG nuclease family protein [Nitrospirota bacterium]MBI3595098.1 GIY-YIG nuclease family protein [Nitrospirota bacterium]
MPWHVYILRCADNTFYTGIAKDLARRISEHHSGTGAKYTRGRGPVTLVYQEKAEDLGSALRREREIKKLTAAKKKMLVVS